MRWDDHAEIRSEYLTLLRHYMWRLRKALLTHIYVRFEFLLHFFLLLSILSRFRFHLRQCQSITARSRVSSALCSSNFPPAAAHNTTPKKRASQLSTVCDSTTTVLEKLVFLRNSTRLFESRPESHRQWKKWKRKRKKAISLIKRWFFTVDRLSWWTKLKVNGWKTHNIYIFIGEKKKKVRRQWSFFNRGRVQFREWKSEAAK